MLNQHIKYSNKNGGLLFESENSGINYTRYDFDVGAGESVGIMKGSQIMYLVLFLEKIATK